MEMEITLPDEMAVMTLPNLTFFPQALLPLHIFEPRYRRMLSETLASNRLFAVASLKPASQTEADEFEPPCRVATVGIVRACQKNEDETSNLLLQGLARVEIVRIVREEPYRVIQIRALTSKPGASSEENAKLRQQLGKLLTTKARLGAKIPGDFAQFLKTVEDPETFVDLAAFGLLEDGSFKQRLLETLDVHRRLQLFSAQVKTDIEAIKLRKKLQGSLGDDDIIQN
ncbi:MAG TPA: LON peptidase substrate-binding domain-containing protein [Opitutaceae bacterium]|nr:LON peptidase substrate-binding domain-containing protein [Opitutaceae bacterium]